MEVNCGDLTLIFQIVELNFIEFNIQNIFKRYRANTLRKAMEKDEFRHLASKVKRIYSTYLDVPLGEFLFELKKRGDKFYIEFLHSNGDTSFCKFKLKYTLICSVFISKIFLIIFVY